MATATRPDASGSLTEPLPTPPLLPLENGDRLTRDEFERRYDAMPDLKKAELIEGIVYMGSPVKFRGHSQPHFDVIGWLSHYQAGTPGVAGGDKGSLRLDLDNMPQPDAFLIVEPAHGGQAEISGDDYVVGAPELVAEVASSSVSYDLHGKLRVYRRNGVREYVVWRVKDRAILWFVLRGAGFEPLAQDAAGYFRSEVFPGLWLDPSALIRGDLAAAFRVVQQGLATPEHAAFVLRLQQAAPPAP